MTFEVRVNESLAAFVRTRLDEVEATAKQAGGSDARWILRSHPSEHVMIADNAGEPVVWDEGAPSEGQAAHMAANDPRRILADVQVWRRLLVEYRSLGLDARFAGTERETGFHLALSAALKFKAATWADHPDYRPAWEDTP